MVTGLVFIDCSDRLQLEIKKYSTSAFIGSKLSSHSCTCLRLLFYFISMSIFLSLLTYLKTVLM